MERWIDALYNCVEDDMGRHPKIMPARTIGFFELWDRYCKDPKSVPVFAAWINKVLF